MDMNPKILRACRNLRQVLFLYSKVLYRIFLRESINIKIDKQIGDNNYGNEEYLEQNVES